MPSEHWVRQVRAPGVPSHVKPAWHVITPAWNSWPSQLPPGAIWPLVVSVNGLVAVPKLSIERKYVPAARLVKVVSSGLLHCSEVVHAELSSVITVSKNGVAVRLKVR